MSIATLSPASVPPVDSLSAGSTSIATAGVADGLQHIARLAGAVNTRLAAALGELESINLQTRLLSFNAQLEASRAGDAGQAFDVVAREMVALSDRTGDAARRLEEDTQADLADLSGRIGFVATAVRGQRLSDLAYGNIDLVDRNLYERSCDVRWWATDASCVQALEDPARSAAASRRLGVILDAYTVYYDIVLCDLDGRVIASGRPRLYASQGTRQDGTPWFRAALGTRSGSEFGFAGLHRSPSLAGGRMTLVYSAAVRRGGQANGEIVGCLGVVFNWEALAQTIVLRTPLGEREARRTRVLLVDDEGLVLADNRGQHLRDRFALEQYAELMTAGKSYVTADAAGEPSLVAYARSPGFETYATGWHSFIVQALELD